MAFPKGKKVHIDPSHPEALGICDSSGFVHLRKDLVRQMEWRGDRLVWTGFLVGKDYVDTPNPQLRPPILPPDPVPIKMPRIGTGGDTPTPMVPSPDQSVLLYQLQTHHWGS